MEEFHPPPLGGQGGKPEGYKTIMGTFR